MNMDLLIAEEDIVVFLVTITFLHVYVQKKEAKDTDWHYNYSLGRLQKSSMWEKRGTGFDHRQNAWKVRVGSTGKTSRMPVRLRFRPTHESSRCMSQSVSSLLQCTGQVHFELFLSSLAMVSAIVFKSVAESLSTTLPTWLKTAWN